jgi:hypothetical protein
LGGIRSYSPLSKRALQANKRYRYVCCKIIDWTPIPEFHGSINGNGFRIRNFLVDIRDTDINAGIPANAYYGGLIIQNFGTIDNLTIESDMLIANLVSENVYVGVFTGINHGIIKNSHARMASGGNGMLRVFTRPNPTYPFSTVINTYVGTITGSNTGALINCSRPGLPSISANNFIFERCRLAGQHGVNASCTTCSPPPSPPCLICNSSVCSNCLRCEEGKFGHQLCLCAGTGTAQNPFRIRTAQNLKDIRQVNNVHYRLLNDIDMSNYHWTPIPIFRGTLEGNNKTIYNLLSESFMEGGNEEAFFIGMFRENRGTIRNLTIQAWLDVYELFIPHVYAGVFAGLNDGTIENCTSIGIPNECFNSGYMIMMHTMDHSTFSSQVISAWTGGIAGLNRGTIRDSTNFGNIISVTNSEGNADGISGYSAVNAVLQNNQNFGLIEFYTIYGIQRMSETGLTLPRGLVNIIERSQLIFESPEVQEKLNRRR